jgi:hypothetical protein
LSGTGDGTGTIKTTATIKTDKVTTVTPDPPKEQP